MVTTFLPAAAETGVMQERVGAPFRCTVQAPHRAMPHPYLVPVRPIFSRSAHSSGMSGGTSSCCGLPFTVREIIRYLLAGVSGTGHILPESPDLARDRMRETMPLTMSEHPSVCPLDCPDTCSLTVTVEQQQIVRIRGSRANPYTAGVICAKVADSYPAFVHGSGRIRTPLRRIGAKGEGRFERVSWDEALDLVHDGFTRVMAEHGAQAILPLNYAGPHGLLAGGSMDLRFFHKLGASLLDRRPLCGGIRTEAWAGTFGAVPGIRPEGAAHAKLIVAWGNNVTWSNLHLTPIINGARKAGAKVVVVDPKRTKIAEQADLHLPILPGTDVVLAWTVAAELERRSSLDRDFIARHVEGF